MLVPLGEQGHWDNTHGGISVVTGKFVFLDFDGGYKIFKKC